MIYPVDSAIYLLNIRGQVYKWGPATKCWGLCCDRLPSHLEGVAMLLYKYLLHSTETGLSSVRAGHLQWLVCDLTVFLLYSYFSVPCTYREDCSLGSWGSWRGDIKVNIPGCYRQTRTKPYNHPLQTKMMRFSCDGLNTDCRPSPVDTRMQCMFFASSFALALLAFTLLPLLALLALPLLHLIRPSRNFGQTGNQLLALRFLGSFG